MNNVASAQPPRRRPPGGRARTGNKVKTQRIIMHHAHYYQYCLHLQEPVTILYTLT